MNQYPFQKILNLVIMKTKIHNYTRIYQKYYPYIQLNINNFEKANKYFQEEIYPNF